MEAMILAAGKGTRLFPLTKDKPKCMVDIKGKPLILHQIEWLKKNGIKDIVINLHYLPENVTDFLGEGKVFGVNINYSDEKDRLMGTAGGVKKAEGYFQETFLVVYGDIYTDIDLGKLEKYHKEKKSSITLCIRKKQAKHFSTLIKLDKNNRITEFMEKPEKFPRGAENIENCGIYICDKKILTYIPENRFFDFAYDVFPKLVKGEKVYGYLIPEDSLWYELGRLEKYLIFIKDFEQMSKKQSMSLH